MKKLFLGLFLAFVTTATFAQKEENHGKIISDAEEAKAAFLKDDPSMASLFESAYGYIILPNVGKGAFLVGGASGNGAVYEGGSLAGMAKMTQVTIGFQMGGQSYSEVVFFENQASFERLKENKVEMSAQVSAVAAASGVSANAKYVDGVAVFTRTKGGLMYEASVGGQQFKFTAK
jgi:lipid-binding SYLF domain-containing protein